MLYASFRCICWLLCSAKRGTNETTPEIPLITCSESGLCVCNNRAIKGTAELDVSTSGSARAESITWGLLLMAPFIMELSNRLF
ncbi:hypothetical protein EMCRGX_G016352 [Ephydatia muelleri]